MPSGERKHRRKLERKTRRAGCVFKGAGSMAVADHISRKLMLSLAAIVLTTSALFPAYYLGGPMVRALLGPPIGFHEPSTDFTSPEMLNQAFVAQITWVGVMFLGLGAIFGRASTRPWRLAFWASNPLSICVGYIVFMLLYKRIGLPGEDSEYYSPRNGLLLAIVSPIAFSLCFRFGAYLSAPLSKTQALTSVSQAS